MNYQENMTAYHAYVNENKDADRIERKNIWIWLLLLFLLLLVVWTYFNMENIENKTNTAKIVLVDKIEKKIVKEEKTLKKVSLLMPKITAVSRVNSENISAKEKVLSTELNEPVPSEMFHLYIVSKGENLHAIAEKQYGDRSMYIKIVNANLDLLDPNNIHAGQEILLPIVNEEKSYSDILRFK